jgi:hypothetical protein
MSFFHSEDLAAFRDNTLSEHLVPLALVARWCYAPTPATACAAAPWLATVYWLACRYFLRCLLQPRGSPDAPGATTYLSAVATLPVLFAFVSADSALAPHICVGNYATCVVFLYGFNTTRDHTMFERVVVPALLLYAILYLMLAALFLPIFAPLLRIQGHLIVAYVLAWAVALSCDSTPGVLVRHLPHPWGRLMHPVFRFHSWWLSRLERELRRLCLLPRLARDFVAPPQTWTRFPRVAVPDGHGGCRLYHSRVVRGTVTLVPVVLLRDAAM